MSAVTIPAPPVRLNSDPRLTDLYNYLYRLHETLGVALTATEDKAREITYKALGVPVDKATGKVPEDAVTAYQNLKALIVKTANDVTSTYRKLVTEMTAEYRAQSEYGTYEEYLKHRVETDASMTIAEWDRVNGITAGMDYIANSSGYIKVGLVKEYPDGTADVGVVVGQDLRSVTIDGKEIVTSQNLYSLWTADSLSFWRNATELTRIGLEDFFVERAYISETTTQLLQSPTFGVQLVLRDDVLKAIAGSIDLSANSSIKLSVSSAMDSVQVGGKNYIMGTAGEYVAESDGSERRWLFPWACKDATTARGLYGQTVTVSFDYDQDIQSGGVGMHFGRNWLGVKNFTAGQATAQRFEGVFDLPALESPGDDEDNVILYLDGTWNGRVTFRNMKLELGNKATDWTPNPEEFRAGSSILMNKDEVNISTPKFNVNIVSEDGETNMLSIDEEGANMPRLTAGNVAARYDGPSTLYVDPNATAAQIEAGNYCRSLADALSRIHQRWLDKAVFIKLAPGMTEYGTLTLTSVTGGNWIYINGDPSNPAKLVGRLNLYFNLSPIKIEHLNIDTTSVGLNMEGCSTVQYWHGIITGPGVSVGGTSCVTVAHNSHVYVSNSELYDCECALYSVTGSAINSSENKGNCRVRANGAIVYAHWAQPCDSTTWVADEWAGKVFTANVSVDQGYKPTPVPAPTSASVTANLTDSWYSSSKAWLNSDNYMRQGYTSNNGEWSGCMWFDTSAFSGKTIQSAALTIKRDDGYGRAGAVTLKLWGTTATTNSGNPNTGAVSYGALGTIENGETKTFTLPITAAQALASGTIKGFMLRSDDGGVMSGRTYSYNYCRISTMPVLAVTFT